MELFETDLKYGVRPSATPRRCNLPRQLSLFGHRMDDHAWTTGGKPDIRHCKLIAVGGYGEVHDVCSKYWAG
jgi:hypothetical protein